MGGKLGTEDSIRSPLSESRTKVVGSGIAFEALPIIEIPRLLTLHPTSDAPTFRKVPQKMKKGYGRYNPFPRGGIGLYCLQDLHRNRQNLNDCQIMKHQPLKKFCTYEKVSEASQLVGLPGPEDLPALQAVPARNRAKETRVKGCIRCTAHAFGRTDEASTSVTV
jgi:hypothetical protein